MLRITLDMDDVLADTHGKLIEFALQRFEFNHLESDFRVHPLRESAASQADE